MQVSDVKKEKLIQDLIHQESQDLRKTREKQAILDYESLMVIGKRTFGEVHVCREKKTGNINSL